MTTREVIECTKRINRRKKEEAKFNAKLHGATVQEDAVTKVDMKLTDEQKEIAKRSMQRMMREKQEEAARKKQRIKR
jgi:hypothetical protein